MSQIGFILLTHNKPHQMLRLVERLNSMFDHPPIVCHHDFGKCPLPDGFLPGNAEFVQPHLSTGWAEFSVVKATAIALKQMYQRPDSPDWCVILSGSCYPTKPAAQILANLDAGGYDAHVEGQEVRPDLQAEPWHRMFYERLHVKTLHLASVDKRLRPRVRRVRLPHSLGRHLLPFHRGLLCFAGSQWFTAGRRAAEYIIAFQNTSDAGALAKHYDGLLFTEESYFQTILYNAPRLTLHSSNWVYLDWSEKKANPKQLTLGDLDVLQASLTHFARKFDPDASADLLDALDRIIDGGTTHSDDSFNDDSFGPVATNISPVATNISKENVSR